MVAWATGKETFQQRRVSVRLPVADWEWFDHYVKFGSEADDRAISWALRQYIERERKQQDGQARKVREQLQGTFNADV
ncbi:MAG: hypothetical protein ABSD73_12425 [Candidatus Bathyarchaeia archaeon]|jgi:metal-responsive CopG/Arc/MetJ family transcriptional regulator